jgi:phage-related protein
MADKFAAIGQLAQENSGLFVTLAAVIGGIAISVLAVNTAMKIYTAYTKLAAAATFLWNAALAANPVVLVGIAIAALVAGLVIAYNKFDSFRNLVDTLFDGMKTGFKVVVDVIRGYINTLVGFYKGLFNGIADIWNNTVGKLSFKIPGWVPGIGGKGFEVPQIPKLAEGGIVTGPTIAMIGERGPEAVIPLSGRNAPAMGNNITINVNGGDPNAVVSALRNYMRTNGSVPIKVSNAY